MSEKTQNGSDSATLYEGKEIVIQREKNLLSVDYDFIRYALVSIDTKSGRMLFRRKEK